MTSRLVALLRGVNVGKANRVAMADLRALVSELGYGDVETLLNSGNVVFTCAGRTPRDAAARIQKALASKLRVTARVMAMSAVELAEVVTANPLLRIAPDPSRLLVAFLGNPADRSKLAPLTMQDWGKDRLAVGSRAAYLWCADGVSKSKLSEALNKALGEGVTSRNWATMVKLLKMAQERP